MKSFDAVAFTLIVLSVLMPERPRRQRPEFTDDDFTRRVLGLGIEVHKKLRVGLLENAYETCFAHDLVKHGFSVVRQMPLAI